ncbi:MAG: M28 family metallopeptidase [Promethearchaeota archaeon]
MAEKQMNEELQKYMYKFIEEICTEIGPRESGTEQEVLTGNKIEDEFKKVCDDTYQEEYISHPHAFLGGIRYGAISVLVSIVLYWLSLLIDLNFLQLEPFYSILFIIIALILVTTAICYFILNVMKYYEVFDFLFPKRKSRNVIGIINPSGEIKNTVIFSAHHDSAFEFNTFYYLGRIGQIIINLGYFGVAIIFIIMILKLTFQLVSIDFVILFFSFGIFFIIFTPIGFVYIFFHSYHPVPGAVDNLSGVAIVLGVGKFLHKNKIHKETYPTNTKVVLISFAGEEAGLRGSKRYLKSHIKELKEDQAIIINIESIAIKDIVLCIDKEPGIGAKHDPQIIETLYEIAKEINPNAKIGSLPFGATDAATFSKKGIPAVSLAGLNLKDELAPYYHTRKDKPEVIEQEALGQAVQICIEFLRKTDSKITI